MGVATTTSRLWDNHRTAVVTTAAATLVTTAGVLWLLQRRRQWNSNSYVRQAFQDSVAKSLAGPHPQMVSAIKNSSDVQMLTTLYKGNSSSKVTAVLVHGFGCTSLEFAALRQELQRQLPQLGVLSYDRILFVQQHQHHQQQQSTSKMSRTATALAEELHCLLQNRSDLQPPFLLIGHSYGGLVAQWYAHLHPEQVVGMVLLDPAHQHQFQQFPADFAMGFTYAVPVVLRIYQALAWTGLLQLLDSWGLFNFPPIFLFQNQEIRRACAKLYSEGIVWRRVADELQGCFETFDEMNASGNNIRNSQQHIIMPLGLVIAGHRQYSPTLFPNAVTAAFLQMHQSMYQNNDHGKLFLASQSDHWIHMQEPKVVVQAVQYVLQKIRDKH
jgi:pimeloyl-ACP methyl ester carboxylesterase